MDVPQGRPALDRHALVMTIWLSLGFAAAVLLHLGLERGAAWLILGAFGVLVAAFLGHVIVNAVLGARFTTRELALGLVLYGAALVAFGLAILLSPGFAARAFWPLSGGFVLLLVVVVFYMITQFGVRVAFQGFDVIRSFRAGPPGRAKGSPSA
ncbi:MAG: hypothetical protein U1E62_15450 [Alsobacter sp.]